MGPTTPKSKVSTLRKSKKKNRPLTQLERRNAQLLWTKWEEVNEEREKREEPRLRYIDLARQWNVTEGTIGLYLKGKLALNTEWMLRFPLSFGVLPQDIWPDWEYTALTQSVSPRILVRLITTFLELSVPLRERALKNMEEIRVTQSAYAAEEVQRASV